MKNKNLKVIAIAIIVALITSCKKEEVSPNDNTSTPIITPVVTTPIDNSVQGKLDAGKTPLEIFTADKSLYNTIMGSKYQGGLIVVFDTINGTGMVAATEDQGSVTNWGCSNYTLKEVISIPGEWITIVLATQKAYGTGQMNTNMITDFCQDSNSPAKICSDLSLNGYDDWFLPSKDELELLVSQLSIQEDLIGSYWSSTQEDTPNNARVYVVAAYQIPLGTTNNYGYLQPKTKSPGRKVRAVRTF